MLDPQTGITLLIPVLELRQMAYVSIAKHDD